MDVLPASNGEHFPASPNATQIGIMKLYDEEAERVRRNYGMSRRQFVRTSAAFAVGLWAINQFNGGKYGYYAIGEESIPKVSTNPTWDANVLNNPGVQLKNLPGEFVFDVQSHHIAADLYHWRAMLPVHYAFICAFPFGASGEFGSHDTPQPEADICEYAGRWHYLQDMFLDSATTATVLSPVPAAPDEQQPLPFEQANKTADLVAGMAKSMRTVTHAYVMPNRGGSREKDPTQVEGALGPDVYGGTGTATVPSTWTATGQPLYPFLQDELDWMEERAMKFGHYLRGWKVYTPYGDVPFSSGMRHDDHAGMAMNEQILKLNKKYGIPKVLASHKGVPLPTFDNNSQHTNDVPKAAKAYPDIRFVIYHSAGGSRGTSLYPLDRAPVDMAAYNAIKLSDFTEKIWGLLKNLRENGLDAQSHIPAGLAHGNSPNVFVDLGSVNDVSPDVGAIFYGTMIKHLGMRRICWGTDSIWYGSPQPDIVRLRALKFTDSYVDANGKYVRGSKEIFNLPFGLQGDRYDPRVDTNSGAQYTAAYAASIPVLKTKEHGGYWLDAAGNKHDGWPTDGRPHPERSLLNGMLGRNAADAYEVDPDAWHGSISGDDVNKAREQYLGDKVNGLASAGPNRTNRVYGPRTKQETIAMLNQDWKKNGWRA
jgi:predicted TIM-barrel fold metal-dependent hydrolase